MGMIDFQNHRLEQHPRTDAKSLTELKTALLSGVTEVAYNWKARLQKMPSYLMKSTGPGKRFDQGKFQRGITGNH